MKPLLFDQNLSPRLVNRLADLYPGSIHIDSLGLGIAGDREIWEYAKIHSFTIVTKDSDFSELVLFLGIPPKVIWIRRGNCSTNAIETLLKDNHTAIAAFCNDPESDVLTLF